ncbi:hypothetical protein [Natrinema versiforme]|uniref:Uncharacterized protein n=1 Tax=Natrinema versiforme TaxID=88724 RepID=A0A4P8WMD7_9EURY|nr:hypothetical protein [Natrinema versiforme]QCS44749.1 hypothetical protein FEJ81_20965 [Natrinema versiforme]
MEQEADHTVTQEELLPLIRDRVNQTNVLVIGGPRVGKSTPFKESDEFDYFTTDVGSDISQSNKPVVIDNLYQNFTEASKEEWSTLLGHQEGLCLIERPRRLNWLLTNSEFSDVFDPDLFEVVYVRYRRSKFCNTGETSVEDKVTELLDEPISNREIQKKLDKLRYTYSGFQTESFPLASYDSYLPFIVAESRFSFESDPSLFANIIKRTGINLGENTIISNLLGSAEKVAGKVFNSDTINISLGGLSTKAGLALILIGWYYHKEKSKMEDDTPTAVRNFLEPLTSQYMLPHTQEVIEEELELPPGTLERVHALVSSDVFDQLAKLDAEDLADVSSLRSDIQQNMDELEEFESRLDSLEENVEFFTSTGVVDLGGLVRGEKRAQRKRLSDANIPAAERNRVLDAIGSSSLRPSEVEKVTESLTASTEGSSCLVVHGPRGIGKSSFLYSVGESLAENGFETGVINPNADPAFIEQNLRERTSDESKLAIFYKYDPQEKSATEIRQLFGSTLAPYFDALIIETTDEYLPQLEATWTQSGEGGQEHSRAQFKDMVENTAVENPYRLTPLPDDQVQTIINLFELTDEEQQDIVQQAEGNPLVAVEAAILCRQGQDLSGLSQRDILTGRLRRAIDQLSGDAPVDRITIEMLLLSLASVRHAPDLPTLFDIADIPDRARGSLEKFVRIEMSGYVVQHSEYDYWKLTPDVYIDIIFQEFWFDSVVTESTPRRETLLKNINEYHPTALQTVARNMGTAWRAAESEFRQQRALEIIDLSEPLFALADDRGIRMDVLNELVYAGVPVPTDSADGDFIYMHESFRAKFTTTDLTEGTVQDRVDVQSRVVNLLSQWMANYIISELTFDLPVDAESSIQYLLEMMGEIADQMEADTPEFDRVVLYTNVLSHTLGNISEDVSAEQYGPWFVLFESIFDDQFESDANESVDDIVMEGFYKTVYHFATDSQVADEYGILRAIEDRIGERFGHKEVSIQKTLEFYVNMLFHIHNNSELDTDDPWVKNAVRQMDDVASESEFETNAREALQNQLTEIYGEVPSEIQVLF